MEGALSISIILHSRRLCRRTLPLSSVLNVCPSPAGAADFVGIFPDESSDEAGTVQVPNGWRPVVLEQNLLALFLDLYSQLPAGAGLVRRS